jgi:hypothetical protein
MSDSRQKYCEKSKKTECKKNLIKNVNAHIKNRSHKISIFWYIITMISVQYNFKIRNHILLRNFYRTSVFSSLSFYKYDITVFSMSYASPPLIHVTNLIIICRLHVTNLIAKLKHSKIYNELKISIQDIINTLKLAIASYNK